MKRILITGKNSYIGTALEKYLLEYNVLQESERYRILSVSQRDSAWEEYDFSTFDTILDVTGIAHVDTTKISEEEKRKYYEVNCDLAVRTAKKAKAEGVRQFIYLSSIIVYGESAPVGKTKHITMETSPKPVGAYGESKWMAEKKLQPLAEEDFKVAILRLPFVYGFGCKGNYRLLSKLAKCLPVFPTIRNKRSMIYIENLCEFLRLLVDSGRGGLWFPQNAEYGDTGEMVRSIAKFHQKRIWGWGWLNPIVCIASKCPGRLGRMTNKAFGSITYDVNMSKGPEGYCLFSFYDSIARTERKE